MHLMYVQRFNYHRVTCKALVLTNVHLCYLLSNGNTQGIMPVMCFSQVSCSSVSCYIGVFTKSVGFSKCPTKVATSALHPSVDLS